MKRLLNRTVTAGALTAGLMFGMAGLVNAQPLSQTDIFYFANFTYVGPNPACGLPTGTRYNRINGDVSIHTDYQAGVSLLNVQISGHPNTVYNVDLRCVIAGIGNITTDRFGHGTTQIKMSAITNGPFYIDVYNGAFNETFIAGPFNP